MRKPVLFGLIAVIVALLGVSGVLYQKLRQTTSDYTDTKTAEQKAESRYGEAINAIAEIQDSLSTVALGDSSVQMLSQQLRSERNLGGPNGNEALDRIAVLKAGLERTKEKIRTLEANLHRSGVKVAGLQKLIAGLKASVSEREATIAQLTGERDSLNLRVTDLAATVSQNEQTIATQTQTLEERRREIGTVYYVVGTKKMLADKGLIVARGGVLGIGKTVAPTGKLDPTLFTPLDTDHESTVATNAAKAQVLTAQPPNSYELRIVDGRIQLHILDPQEFRKVRTLVIMTS